MNLLRRSLGIAALCVTMLFAGCSGNSASSISSEPVPSKSALPGKKVYFAGPLFNAAEKEFNLRMAQVLEDYDYQVFLPQRDGVEGALLENKTEEEAVDIIFPLDVENVLKADILFMNLDGRAPDEGACVELGIAYQAGKRCYGFKTDTRAAESAFDLNPMITGCMTKIFKNFDGEALIAEIKDYLAHNDL